MPTNPRDVTPGGTSHHDSGPDDRPDAGPADNAADTGPADASPADDAADRPGHGPVDVGAFIREQRQLAELSLRRLADLAGVSNPYLSQIERGLRKPSAEILQQLAKALELSAETMYVRAGILDADHGPDSTSLESAIRHATDLSEEQRKALLSVYRSFVTANTAMAGATDTDPQGDDPEGSLDGDGASR